MELAAGPISTAPLRACATCVRAKAKCVPGEGFQMKCQRCYRLSKSCEPATSRSRTEPRKRKMPDASRVSKVRVEKLEEKLDDLVTLLKSAKQTVPTAISPTPTLITSANTASSRSPDAELLNGPNLNASATEADDWDERLHLGGPLRKRFAMPEHLSTQLMSPLVPGTTTATFRIESLDLGGQDHDVLLNIFRTDMCPNFPFVRIPNDMMADELRQDRPSLYTAVMSISSRITTIQRSLGVMLTQQIAKRVHVDHERNLDLLLACLTYTTWCPFHFFNIPILTSLLSTAHTLIGDLGLNRPGLKEDPGPFKNAILNTCGVVLASPIRSLEDRRAALGSWYLTSVMSSFFHRLEKPQWTPYLDECCQLLSGIGDEDAFVVGLVKIQLTAERILMSPWHGNPTSSSNKSICLPPIIYLKSVESQVEELKQDLSAILQHNVVLRLNICNISILLYKIGLSKSGALSTFTGHDFNRVEILFKCAQACKSFFDNQLSIPVEKYRSVSVPMCSQITGNLGILQLLSTFDHPEWDTSWLREKISFIDILGQLERKYGAVKLALGFDPHTSEGEDIFSQTSAKMGWMKGYFENKATDAASREQQKQECIKTFFPQPDQTSIGTDPTLTDPIGEEMLDFFDDAWMRDILMPWDYQDRT